jgi:diguanylate cyclase (GGDEF)-like protein
VRANQAKLLLFVGTVGLVVAMSAYALALNIENNNLRSKVQVHATSISSQLEVALDQKFEVLYGLQALFNASVYVDAEEFALAANGFLKRDPALEGLEWVPKVPHDQAADYVENALYRIPDFTIKESLIGGGYKPAEKAEAYYPVYYLEPQTIYRDARGLNLASYGPTWTALKMARDTGELAISDVLSEEPTGSKHFALIFAVLPIYKPSPLTLSERRDNLQGFVVALVQSANVLNGVVANFAAEEMVVSVEMPLADGKRGLIYNSRNAAISPKETAFSQSVTIPLQNEQWILTVTPTAVGEGLLRSNTPIGVFVLVLIFTAIGSVTIGVLIRQRELVSDAVVERTNQLNVANERLEKLSNTDFLTGLSNRRRFEALANDAWRRSRESGHRLGVLMVDVDHFKHYNDHFGHLAGDTCLKRVANVLRGEIGEKTDLLARYGGEEFIAMLEEDAATTSNVSRLLLAVREQHIEHAPLASKDVLTVSIGVAWLDSTTAKSLDQFINAADDALYKAKELGRDQLVEVEFS